MHRHLGRPRIAIHRSSLQLEYHAVLGFLAAGAVIANDIDDLVEECGADALPRAAILARMSARCVAWR
jgi:hypothetical protein